MPDVNPEITEDTPSPPAPADPHAEFITNHNTFERMLQRECRAWQHKLKLADWTVKVNLVRLNQMGDDEAIGSIFPCLERKYAQMQLLSPIDVPLKDSNFPEGEALNYDLTIVHELLHLHLLPFTQNLSPADQVAEEQAINAISQCLVKAAAKQKPPLQAPPTSLVGHYL